jgi:hypothetical protein
VLFFPSSLLPRNPSLLPGKRRHETGSQLTASSASWSALRRNAPLMPNDPPSGEWTALVAQNDNAEGLGYGTLSQTRHLGVQFSIGTIRAAGC